MATIVAKVRTRLWIIGAHDLPKPAKFICVLCREIDAKNETQFMADLPGTPLEPFMPPFYYTACDFFGPYKVRIGRDTTAKHYGVTLTCMNTRAVLLELAVDYSTVEFMQTLRRFFAIRGQPALMMSDNCSQLVAAERELFFLPYYMHLLLHHIRILQLIITIILQYNLLQYAIKLQLQLYKQIQKQIQKVQSASAHK